MKFSDKEIKEYMKAMEIIIASCTEEIDGTYLSLLVNAMIKE